MKSPEYWQKRLEALSEAQLNKGTAYANRTDVEYKKAMAKIKKDTDAWYQRLAKNNDVSVAGARKLLKANELEEFKWDVKDYIKAGRENAVDQRWMKQLENASAKVHISRLEAQQLQMRQHIEMLSASKQAGTKELLGGIYKDSYYKSIFELQKGLGVGASFAKLDNRQLEMLLSRPWAADGAIFSSRIWKDKVKLLNELDTTLIQSLIRGDPSDQMIKAFAERMGVSMRDARRLVMTEAAYFSGQATLDGYRELGVEEYQFMATLDRKTSKMCRFMDLKIFPIEEARAGLNYPPLHAHCRSTTVPHYEGNIAERIARGADGKTYTVSGNMNFTEWAEKYAEDANRAPRLKSPKQAEPDVGPLPPPGALEEPPGIINRRYNPKASYHLDLPGVPEHVTEQLAIINREIVRLGSKEAKETAVILNAKTGSELGRLSGSLNKVTFTEEMHKVLIEAPKNSVILTHNHPSGTRINVKDLQNLALYPSLSSIIAAGHVGGMSSVSTLGITTDLLIFNNIMAKSAQEAKQRLQSDARYATMSKSEKVKYFDHVVLLAIIEEMGWEYVEDYTAARGANWGI
ncbi:minor capsid protein [Paenibacillus sp. FSL H8-0034]|uniref:minor capsid protein n=1 Tax=Paenibacillus sp. FSL H8-0034 TaxID=2954671 RepID=UPI0030FD0D97